MAKHSRYQHRIILVSMVAEESATMDLQIRKFCNELERTLNDGEQAMVGKVDLLPKQIVNKSTAVGLAKMLEQDPDLLG